MVSFNIYIFMRIALQIFSSTINMKHLWNWMIIQMILIQITIIHMSQSQQTSTNTSVFSFITETVNKSIVKRQTVKMIKLQRFLVEPENMTVNIGESIILPCRVSNKAGTVQWTRDGFGLGADPRLEGFPTYSMIHNDETGDYSLKISSVTLEDDATFQCQVGALDNVPGIRSQNANLTIRVQPEDPVIVLGNPGVAVASSNQELQVLHTTAGNKVELTCEAHGGRPAAELSWINSRNQVVKKGITSKITTMNDRKRYNSALKWVFEPTKSDHNKKLSCRSSHPTIVNSSSTAIILEVKYAPEVKLEVSRIISQQQQQQQQMMQHTNPLTVFGATNLHGRVGDTIKFKCIADGNPGKNALMFEWLRGNEVIIGDHGNELIIDNIDKTFNGAEIVCRVSNSVGTGMASITLNIAYGPTFLTSMEYVYGVNSGDTVRLSCPVEGNPIPEITWIKVGTSSVMSTGSKLTIRNANEDSVGEYLCRVSVKGFAEISAIVYLRLNGPPKIRKKKSSHHYDAVMGEQGHIECLIESVPAPIAITWIHNGQIFTSGSSNNIPTNIEIHEERLKEEAVVLKASFDIRTTLQNDFGYYNCVVVNSYGSDWHLVSLNEKTSFSTIVIFVSISISVLVFIVLSTIIFLLTLKHRKLMRKQDDNDEQAKCKEHYMGCSDVSDNHNIYSTHSTRTNSSSDKNGPTETGTIITRSGSTGSPRSSTSSFPAYLDSNNSPGLNNRMMATTTTTNHPSQSRSSPSSSSHHHIHSPTGLFPDPARSPFYTNSVFDVNSPMNISKTDVIAMPPINSAPYSTLTRHLAFSPLPSTSLRNSYSSYIPQMYQQYEISPLGVIRTSNDMYQANPYQVLPASTNDGTIGPQSTLNRIKTSTVPTPTPSLAKELDNCISKNSIATHV